MTVEIDGLHVTVPDGTSVMRAASLLGNQIPKLCATGSLKAFGSCRLCLVEIDGRKGYPASCTTTVAEGMKVRTQSEKLAAAASQRDGAVPVGSSVRSASAAPATIAASCMSMAATVGVTESRYSLPQGQCA